MLRERSNSKYAGDPRITWIEGTDPRAIHAEGGVIFCEIGPSDLPGEPPEPRSDFAWDFEIYPDEVVRVGTAGGTQRYMHAAFLVSADGRHKPLCGWGGYLTLDRMLELLLGDPID